MPKAASVWQSKVGCVSLALRETWRQAATLAHVMQRLKTRPQFQALLGGELVAKTSHFALHRVMLNAPTPEAILTLFPHRQLGNQAWLGAMTPKRWAKRAVTRNTIKRLIYVVSASLIPSSLAGAFLVRLRSGFSGKVYVSASSTILKQAVHAELLVLLQSLGRPDSLAAVAP